MSSRPTCEYCDKDISDPNGTASDEYMRHGHIIMECPNPDKMEKAHLNASPKEREEHWL